MKRSQNALPPELAHLLKRIELAIHRFQNEWTRSPNRVSENHALLIELAEMQTSLTALTVAVNRIRSGTDSTPAPSLIDGHRLGPRQITAPEKVFAARRAMALLGEAMNRLRREYATGHNVATWGGGKDADPSLAQTVIEYDKG